MLAILLTAAVLAVPATQLSDDPANLLPSDTLLYFGTHSVSAGSEAAKRYGPSAARRGETRKKRMTDASNARIAP